MRMTKPTTAATVSILLAITLVALGSAPANARCRSSSLSVTPPSKSQAVPTNVEVLFTVFGHLREKAADLLDGAHFVAGKDRVPVRVETLPQSATSFRNAYLRVTPRRALKARRWYRLVLAPAKPPPAVRPLLQRLRGYHIKTGAGADTKAPAKPVVTSKGYQYRRLGCGPAESIELTVSGVHDDLVAKAKLGLLLEVVEKTAKGERRFSIRLGAPYSPGYASLGHGMCSGNYHLVKGASYTIRVRTVDWAGNQSAPSDAVEVIAR